MPNFSPCYNGDVRSPIPEMPKKLHSQSPWTITKAAKVRLTVFLLLLIAFGVWSGFVFSEPMTPEQATDRSKFLETVYSQGNYIEAGIWGIFSLGFAIRFFRRPPAEKQHAFVAAITFLLFGISDIVEVHTGGWWRPWWLLLWKSACILSMIILLFTYRFK
ncbi:hypothetical protein [Desertifilum sp. FACHB-1129]|uniref:hypothetical protein n=1 Tax=Desertifilum sp. FACHB-1129 TaxID=2692795 RepID=UPI0016832F72|nr:hypothetical protein [Desertifilum sp. FACHB-1129]